MNGESPMADPREALVALLGRPDHAPMSTHDPRDGSCQSCPWPLHEMPPEDIADAILAEFDVTPRGEVATDADWREAQALVGQDGNVPESAPTTRPSVEDVARAIHSAHNPITGEIPAWEEEDPDWIRTYRDMARAVLALLPGRSEAEVYREGYDQGPRDAASVSRSEAEVKAEALRGAAEGLCAGVRGSKCNPGCHEADQITLRLRADHIEKEADRG